MLTSPIVGLILFVLGYDLTVDRKTIAPMLRVGGVRLAWSVLIILGIFLLFASRMADKEFLMAVLIYFMCPTGFVMGALVAPVLKDESETGFISAFTLLYIIVTLIAYTCVVVFIA